MKEKLHIKNVILSIIFALTFLIIVSFVRPVEALATGLSVEDVYKDVNQTRVQNNMPALKRSSALTLAAERKAQDMITYGYWAHSNPTTGSTPWKFIINAGYKGRYVGENLAKDYNDTQSMVGAWMASPTHKQNLLSSNYQETGIAIVTGTVDGQNRTVVVQMFGGLKK